MNEITKTQEIKHRTIAEFESKLGALALATGIILTPFDHSLGGFLLFTGTGLCLDSGRRINNY
jgi:hypothetical protein